MIDALGELPTPEGKAFLIEYLAMTDEERKTLGPPMPASATGSLLRHNLSDEELRGLLTNANSEVSGTAILTVLDHGPDTRRAEMFKLHPRTKELPQLDADDSSKKQ